MKTSEELRQLLNRIDHRGYPAYKETRGAYQFGKYYLLNMYKGILLRHHQN